MEDKKITKLSTFYNLLWKFGERIIAQLITFIVSVVLARLLFPSDYGAIAIILVFINIANVFVDSGFGNALIQKKDSDIYDFSTVFIFNIFFSWIIYGIVFVLAPIIADIYDMPILCMTLRVLALKLPLAGINSVQQAYVSKKIIFKRFFWSTLIGTLISGIVGIVMAYKGFGIWSLVAQYLTNSLLDTVVLWITVKWRPTLYFSFKRLKQLFSFGWKLLASNLIATFYDNLRSFIIGYKYTSEDLAYYTKGKQFPEMLINNIDSSIQAVLFPAIVQAQDDKERLKHLTQHAMMCSSYVIFPAMAGLAAVSRPLILLMLTDKWLDAVPFLCIGAFYLAFAPMQTANLQAIKAMGRSDIYLKLETIKKIFGILTILVSMRWGVMAIAISSIINTLFASIVNSYPNKKMLNYGFKEQIRDLLPYIGVSFIMFMVVYLEGHFIQTEVDNLYLVLFMQVITGIGIYLGLSIAFHLKAYTYIKNIFAKNKENLT